MWFMPNLDVIEQGQRIDSLLELHLKDFRLRGKSGVDGSLELSFISSHYSPRWLNTGQTRSKNRDSKERKCNKKQSLRQFRGLSRLEHNLPGRSPFALNPSISHLSLTAFPRGCSSLTDKINSWTEMWFDLRWWDAKKKKCQRAHLHFENTTSS